MRVRRGWCGAGRVQCRCDLLFRWGGSTGGQRDSSLKLASFHQRIGQGERFLYYYASDPADVLMAGASRTLAAGHKRIGTAPPKWRTSTTGGRPQAKREKSNTFPAIIDPIFEN